MDDSRVTELVNKAKSNDIEDKVDAITKLQSEFEAGVEIPDPDALINMLKGFLRTSNQHLTTATVSAIPPLLPLIIMIPSSQTQGHPTLSNSTSSASAGSTIDAFSLRQVLLAFLPSGGIFDRLGDTREKAREKSRESLVILGGYAFRSGSSSSISSKSQNSKGPESPLAIFERFMKECGLGSKVWRIREQSILTIVHIRRTHHLFPIRPYLATLVGALEDTDGNVRECARQSVVELFIGPGVNDAARSDLKKEMVKKGVRKNTFDSVLSKVFVGSTTSAPISDGSESGDGSAKNEYIPPSLVLAGRKPTVTSNGSSNDAGSSTFPRPASRGSANETSRPPSRTVASPTIAETVGGGSSPDVRSVFIASNRDLEVEFAKMEKHFEGKETEHNWAAREKSIVMVRGMIKGEVHIKYQEAFLSHMKHFLDQSLKTLVSLRTTVAVHTCSLYSELAISLGPLLDPYCDTLLTNLLRMASLTKKLVAQQSQASLTTIIVHTSAQPRLIPQLLSNALQEKNVQARAFMSLHIKTYLDAHGPRSRVSIESVGAQEILEKSIKKSLADQNAGVRDNARKAYWAFERVWKDRGAIVLQGLNNVARKQLEDVCPDPNASFAAIASTPANAKKTSIAAAIAASRAKAKAIANDPPTLRHQATSASQAAARTASPKRAMSPSLSNSSSTGAPLSSHSTGSLMRSRPPVMGTLPRSASGRPISARPLPLSSSSTGPDRRRASSHTPSSPGSSPTPRRASTSPQSLYQPSANVMPSTPTPQPRINMRGSLPSSHQITARQSVDLDHLNDEEDESLLLAMNIPVPDEGESDRDDFSPVTFSSPFEIYSPDAQSNSRPPISPRSSAAVAKSQPISINSPPASAPQPIVEDAMRARAEQAESAAERLLELVEPDEEGAHETNLPSALLLKNGHSGNVQTSAGSRWTAREPFNTPKTPMNRAVAMRTQAAQFQDSPVANGSQFSLLNLITNKKHEKGWWVKRMTLVQHGTPLKGVGPVDRMAELQEYTSALESGLADLSTIQKLALLCVENPVDDVSLSRLSHSSNFEVRGLPSIGSSRQIPSLGADMWADGKNCDRLFTALVNFLVPTKSEDELEYGLIVLWEMLESQGPYLEGREADMFSLLLNIRYSSKINVLEATNAIRDALTTRIEPVYGLTTMHASIRTFGSLPPFETSNTEVKAASYAFGLIALGKFILRLPGEILEEELPRLRVTLTSALTDPSSLLVRESAAAVIIAAQTILRDEAHLFTLLDGLADDKKNLLTYLFERHDARGVAPVGGHSSVDKLEKEMRRLDARTSTPPRSPDDE